MRRQSWARRADATSRDCPWFDFAMGALLSNTCRQVEAGVLWLVGSGWNCAGISELECHSEPVILPWGEGLSFTSQAIQRP